MAMLTGDQIRDAARHARIDRDTLTVPELGGDICVRGMSGTERDRLEESFRVRKGKRQGQVDLRNFRAAMAARVIVNEEGERLLNDGDVEILGRLPSGVLDRIISKCNDLSGRSDEEVDDLGNASASPAASDASASS